MTRWKACYVWLCLKTYFSLKSTDLEMLMSAYLKYTIRKVSYWVITHQFRRANCLFIKKLTGLTVEEGAVFGVWDFGFIVLPFFLIYFASAPFLTSEVSNLKSFLYCLLLEEGTIVAFRACGKPRTHPNKMWIFNAIVLSAKWVKLSVITQIETNQLSNVTNANFFSSLESVRSPTTGLNMLTIKRNAVLDFHEGVVSTGHLWALFLSFSVPSAAWEHQAVDAAFSQISSIPALSYNARRRNWYLNFMTPSWAVLCALQA